MGRAQPYVAVTGPDRVSRIVAAAAAVLLAVGACTKDEPSPTVGPATSTGRPTSSAPTSSSATGPNATSSPTPGAGDCGAVPAPGALRASQTTADADGDGTTDTITVYGTGTDDMPAPYHVQVQLGGGRGAVDAGIVDAGSDSSQIVKVLGAADITSSAGAPPDGSGAEIFVTVGSGAAAAVIGVYQLTGCSLVRLTGPGSQAPSAFTIGGTVTSLGGLRCDGTAGGQRLVVLTAESSDGVNYQTTQQRLQVTGGQFVPSEAPVTGTMSANDPQLQAFSHLDCPGVESP